MLKSISLLLLAGSLSIAACKTGKKQSSEASASAGTAATPPASPPPVAVAAPPMTQTETKVLTREDAKSAPENFRLMVTFISIGAGTDPDGKVLLDNYIAQYKIRTGKSPAYIMIPWGREGEVDCCFNMNELTASEQVDFIKDLRNSMKSRELIQITENARNRFRP